MAAKRRAITIAAEFGKACDNNRLLIVQSLDQQVTPPGLRDDLLMSEQAAQLTLEFGRVM
ncbi:hypothetical protein AWV79_06745 [Cupriavidus sp. UYMMa02A]|nr:hypothetical protein AWV79_06745 [Cupriavidus sp. UYMMa02A]